MMVEFLIRPLNRAEELQLTQEVEFVSRQQNRWCWFCLAAIALVLFVGTPLALNQANQDSGLGKLAFGTLAVYVVVVLWVYYTNTRDNRRRFKENSRALMNDQAQVIRCRSSRVLEVLEEEEFPAIYLFQVDDDRAFYCEIFREDFAREHFPCCEFEVSRVTGWDRRLLAVELKCLGEELVPEMSLSGQAAREVLARLPLPDENYTLLEGTFSGVAEAFLAIHQEREKK